MKKLNLLATFAGCALSMVVMAGAAAGVSPCCAGAGDFPADARAAVESATAVAVGEAEVCDALEFALNAKMAEEQARTEAEAAQKAAEEAAAAAEAEKKAAEEAAAKASSTKSTTSQKSQSASKASSGKATSSSGSKGSASASTPSQKKSCTITIDGVAMDYVDSYGTSSAPSNDAGIWRGSDSTTDGSFGYFIGHDYTDFCAVADLDAGSSVSVTDGDGNTRDYEVVDSFTVPRGTHWSEVADRVTCYGESIAMQTCVEGGYRIVVAK